MKIEIKKFHCSSVNEIYTMHWTARRHRKKEAQELVYYEALKNKKHFDRVRVTFTAYFSDKKKRDPDNLYVKPMMDALVDAGIIDDDNNEIVESVTLKVVTKANEDYIVIEVLPLDNVLPVC